MPWLLLSAFLLTGCVVAQQPASFSASHNGKNEFVIKNAILLTATHGRIENGSVYVKDGKIVAFGANVSAPSTATVIDAGEKYITPGIIDPHSHMALDNDVNEATNPVVPQMMMKDAFDYTDKAIYRALAGGVTSSLLLHGSADMIGGQAVVIKTKYGLDRDQMLFPGAPQSIKFASGENPKRVFGDRKQLPSTRMGNFEVMREAFTQAKDYQRQWDDYKEKVKKGDKTASPPKKDLKLEALSQVLEGKMLVQIHCYRA
ncbi:MAG TPA: amidohydrolase, partial [Terriglobales bacterium]